MVVGKHGDPVYPDQDVSDLQPAVPVRDAAAHDALDLEQLAGPVATDDGEAKPGGGLSEVDLHHLTHQLWSRRDTCIHVTYSVSDNMYDG